MNQNPMLASVVEDIKNVFPEAVAEVTYYRGDTMLRVSKASSLAILTHLKQQHHFIYFVDLVAADRYTTDERFELIYNLVCLRNPARIFVKVRLEEDDLEMESVSALWPAANWNEREAFDMFGIRFANHPDFRRIYMPEDFEYYPLRKDFPLLGIPGSIDLPSTMPDTEL